MRTRAQDCVYRRGRRLTLDIDEETFSQIVQYAKENHLSVSQAVRDLVEFGLLDVGKK